MSKKLSKELFISVGGKLIAGCKDFSLSVNKEVIDVTTLDDAGWRDILPGQKTWSVSLGGIVTRGESSAEKAEYDELLQQMANSDEPVTIVFNSNVVGDTFKTGQAIITSLEESASLNAEVTYSGSAEGKKALTFDTVAAAV
jgi:TP901-1 family phage major tail protein